MALKTKKEFAADCGISSRHISTYVGRRQIVLTEEGKIDDKNEINYAFLIDKGYNQVKKTNGQGKKAPAKKAKPKPKPSVSKGKTEKPKPEPKPEVKKPRVLTAAEKEVKANVEYLASLDKAQKEHTVSKTNHEAEIKRIQMEKLQGKLIPTDLVTSVIQLQAESLKTAYHEAVEKLIIIIGQKKKLSNKDTAEIRKKLTGQINDAINSGLEESQKGIKRIVKEYSESRGVGESKT